MPEIVPFRLDLYNETHSLRSSSDSDQISEPEEDVVISCSHSEISDVNENDGEDDIFGFLYRQEPDALDQTRGKVRTPSDEQDESNYQSNGEDAEDQSIFPEFWIGFNSYAEQTDKDLSKTESDERNESCQHSSVMEPNIIFYQQLNQSKLTKVLDDLTITEDNSSSLRTMPSICLNKVDSSSKDEVLFQP